MNAQEFTAWLHEPFGPVVSPPHYCRKPLVMGVLNVTPDSFSDGGRYVDPDKACQRVDEMIEQGVDLVDIGGSSSRPGASLLSDVDELARVLPVITKIARHTNICLSIDTYHPLVMRAAVEAGVTLINDIMALRMPGALEDVARLGVPVCLMHMQGEPATMQNNPTYVEGASASVHQFFSERILACTEQGIKMDNIMLDPGIGFGKSNDHNLSIIRGLREFQCHHRPIVLGVSRKSTLGAVLKKEVNHRLAGGLGVAVYAALQGAAIIRTHDVDETKQALDMVDAVICAEN